MSDESNLEKIKQRLGKSGDDVSYLIKTIEKSIEVLNNLRYGVGTNCFCEVSIGNPLQLEHGSECIDATAFLEGLKNK